MQRFVTLTILGIWGVLDVAAQVPAQTPVETPPAVPTSCVDCHNKVGNQADDVTITEMLKGSVHGDLDCTDCHTSMSMDDLDTSASNPHGASAVKISMEACGECHEDAAEVYKRHGRLKIGTNPDTPSCWNCHGSHNILPASDPRSSVHPVNLPGTCEACHMNVDLVKRHQFLRDAPIRLYKTSIHGRSSKKGLYIHATCNDCHSSKGPNGKRTAHRILDPGDSESSIYHFNIPDTCGTCHESVTNDYWDGIHGQLVKRGAVDSPVCTTCHGEHGIIRPSDPRSPVNAAHVAEETCAPCHESAVLNEKYGVPAGRLRSYVDSYHGLKAKAGETKVANCASCHGAHRILPSTDPDSSIFPANLKHTCGECHPGISSEMANVEIHETATGIKSGWPHFFTVLYYWLIGVTIGLMLLHCVADWIRNVKIMGTKPFIIRMTPNETTQHWLLALSFIVLVISGFSLRFSETWWVQLLFGWGGGKGFEIRGLVHRIAAVFFLFCCGWHVFYLFSRRGRSLMMDMLARPRDLLHIKENSLYFLGVRKERPRFARFSYMEKCEYWALIWGGVLMSITGSLLWFDDYFVQHWEVPRVFLDVALVIHYYEAWLATLAILVWHGYSTIFSPHVYPMNPAWMTGRMPQDMYAHEHQDGPTLRSYVIRGPSAAEEVAKETEADAAEPTGATLNTADQQRPDQDGPVQH